jgi:hypothetical protein
MKGKKASSRDEEVIFRKQKHETKVMIKNKETLLLHVITEYHERGIGIIQRRAGTQVSEDLLSPYTTKT